MADLPWLTIIGLGEDGPDGLPLASRTALETADVVMGPARHLGLLRELSCARVEWPVPFANGIPQLLALRGRRVVVLASGDPFWFGAGSVIARHLEPGEWRALPGVSTFSLAASRLGWALENTACLGLHAAPLNQLRPHLSDGARLIVLLRDGAAVADLAQYLIELDFEDSTLWVMASLGGPEEKCTKIEVQDSVDKSFLHPVCVAIDAVGPGLALTPGRDEVLFEHDGQITKSPIRALTLAALAPRAGETLWDIGGGSGSVSIEWLLAHPSTRATAIEADPARAKRIRANAAALGVDRLDVIEACAPDGLEPLALPDAVFIGGGLSEMLLVFLCERLAKGTRLVANAVTLDSEALLTHWQSTKGGELMRIEIARSAPIGSKRGWKASYPVVQWSVTI